MLEEEEHRRGDMKRMSTGTGENLEEGLRAVKTESNK